MWDVDLGSIPASHGQTAKKGSTLRVHVNDRPMLVVRKSGKDRADDEMAPADCLNGDLGVNGGDDIYQDMKQLPKDGVLVGPTEEIEN